MSGFDLAGRRFAIPASVLGLAEDGAREIAVLIPSGEARSGDDLLSYATAEDAVDLSLARAGVAPLLIEHCVRVDSMVGAVTGAWFDGPVLCLTGRLVDVPDADRVWAMVTAGLPVAVSLGVEIEAAEPTTPSPWGGQRYIVRQWRLIEVSFCARAKIATAHAVRLDSEEGRRVLATCPPSDHAAARQRLQLDAWGRWALGAGYRIAEHVGADPHRLGELLREEVAAHGERLIAL